MGGPRRPTARPAHGAVRCPETPQRDRGRGARAGALLDMERDRETHRAEVLYSNTIR